MNTFRCTVLVGLGVLIGLMSMLALRPGAGSDAPFQAKAGTASDGSQTMLAVTGKSSRGDEDVLWVIDAEKQQLSCYKYGQRGVEFLGARKIWYDLKIVEYRDTSPPQVRVPVLRKKWLEAGFSTPKKDSPDVTQGLEDDDTD